jgi:DNA repair exonuclease SbcCD ATPase subunit
MAAVATVTPISSGSLISIHDHLEALFNTLEMTEEGSPERVALESDIAHYLEQEIRKVDNVAGYIAHCEAQQQFAADEVKRLQDRKRSWEKRQERLEGYVLRVMDTSGRERLEGRTNTLLRKQCPPSVEVTDQSLVPQEYIRITVMESVDKTAAKQALKTEEIPGLRLVTRFSVVRK